MKLNITHVPFKGAGESVPALLGGHVEVLLAAYPSHGKPMRTCLLMARALHIYVGVALA